MSVTASVEDGVGWITLDRPPANSYDPAFLEELDEAIGQVAAAGVAVGVVRSASEKFFSAGADVKGSWRAPPTRTWRWSAAPTRCSTASRPRRRCSSP